MKGIFSLLALLGLVASSTTQAGIPRSAVTAINAAIYGIYTSSDPLCQTGFIVTVPVRATPLSINMVGSPTIGIGPVAQPLECIVMVMKNSVTMDWLPGSYTSTTNGASDSVCDSGGSTFSTLCGNSMTATWPAQISADVTAAGLTPTTACGASPTGNEVVPVYLSTYAACTGNTTLDATTTGCVNSGNPANNTFQPPAAANDTSRGININSPGMNPNYKFIIDPDQIIGNDSGACRNTSPPRFGFAKITSS